MPLYAKRGLVFLAVALSFVTLQTRRTTAHKSVTSPYNYNGDTFPILRDRCGRCHVEGGPAPMGLMKYNDSVAPGNSAVPWAESIREVLISQQMPPWYVDPMGPAIKGGNPMTPREVDKLITWASGGTPEGDVTKRPAAVPMRVQWKAGPPDLKLDMPADHTVPEATNDETIDVDLPTGLTETRWLKGVDVLPGAAQIVRNAVVSVDNGPILAVWVPGDDLVTAPSGAAFKLNAGAKLHLQIHYKKQWQVEGKSIADRSSVGLYFTDPPASGRELQALVIDPPSPPTGETPQTRSFSGTFTGTSRVVAVRPSLDRVYGTFDVHAVTPTGKRVPLLLLRAPRPEWRRRYWLAEPVELPAGSKIEVTVTPPPDFLDLTAAKLVKAYPLQVALDFVPQN